MGHFYSKTGEPVYEVPNLSKGGMRPTTVRDAKKLGLVKSVTSVIQILDRPYLIPYKLQQLEKAVSEFPYINNEDGSIEEWFKRVMRISEENSHGARNVGEVLHNSLEEFYKTGKLGDCYKDICEPVINFIESTFPGRKWVSEQSFCYLTYGGKVDLHSPCNIDDPIIIDFKTKDTDDIKKLRGAACEDHLMQLSAYRKGLELPIANCYCLYISNKIPNMMVLHRWEENELKRGWEMFKCLDNYWQLSNKMELMDELE